MRSASTGKPRVHCHVRELPAQGSDTVTHFECPGGRRSEGASEYQDAGGGSVLQTRPDVDPKRIGIWSLLWRVASSSLGLARNSNNVRRRREHPRRAGPGAKELDIIGASIEDPTGDLPAEEPWKSPVLLIHADDDRNVPFDLTLDLYRRLVSRAASRSKRRSSRTTSTISCFSEAGRLCQQQCRTSRADAPRCPPRPPVSPSSQALSRGREICGF